MSRRLLPGRHDDLGLARTLEEVAEANYRSDERRRVVARNRAEGRDRSLEAGVDGLQPVARRAAEDDRQVSVELILRDDDLIEAVTVEIDREGRGLEVVELAPAATLGRHLEELHLQVAAAADRGRGPEGLLRVDRDAQAVVLVDEDEAARARRL